MPPPPRSWWSRNWKWFLPVGCLLPVLLCGGFFTVVGLIITGAIKSSDPYKHGVAEAQASSEVSAALGSPVQTWLFPSGHIKVSDNSGVADLKIPLSGANGYGTLHVIATRSGGKWSYSTVDVDVNNGQKQIDVLKKPPSP
jgi:hypothetical protein